MNRRKQLRFGNPLTHDSAKSNLQKLLFLHSNFIFSHIDSDNWKIATYASCQKQKKNSNSLIKTFSNKKAPIGAARPLSAVCYRVPQICQQFMKVSKKKLVQKQTFPTKSARITKKPEQKQKQNGQQNRFELYESIIAKQKNMEQNFERFRVSKKSNTQANELMQQHRKNREHKLFKKKKRITDGFEQISRPNYRPRSSQGTQFKNLQLRKAILNENMNTNVKERKQKIESQFDAWKVQACDLSQF